MGKVKQREDKEERERERNGGKRKREGDWGWGGDGGWRKGERGRRKEEDADYPKTEVLGIREPWVWKSIFLSTHLCLV